jgi:hypothetical protein
MTVVDEANSSRHAAGFQDGRQHLFAVVGADAKVKAVTVSAHRILIGHCA